MLEDMTMRGLREETQHAYLHVVSGFAGFLGRAPDTASAAGLRRFQVHQAESGVQPPQVARREVRPEIHRYCHGGRPPGTRESDQPHQRNPARQS